jgi:LPXTG-motif cell wall-anchored protein
MEQSFNIPFCPIPPETISDMVPLGVVLGLFLVAGWLLRRRKKRRDSSKKS